MLEPKHVANPSTDPWGPPPHRGFGETSWQMVPCFSSQTPERGSRPEGQPAFGDERADTVSPSCFVAWCSALDPRL